MPIIKKDIFEDIFAVYQRLNQIFDERLARSKKEFKSGEEQSSWTPPVDIYEDDSYFLVTAELPGFEKSDIHIKVKENILIIQGRRNLNSPEDTAANYHRIETNFGSFLRTFTLPEAIDKDNVQATYINGVLEIKLPKIKASDTVKIKIE
jgi:HSP20 family protein